MSTRLPSFRSRLAHAFTSLALAAGGLAALPAAHAVTFTETGDAGQTQATAQTPTGTSGQLTDIFGTFSSALDGDLYVITISNPANFSASTVNAASGLLDTQLFLLTLGGAPVYFNDDASGFDLLSTLPAGNALRPVTSGTYLLGIANANYNPVNTANQLLFAGGLTTDVRGAATGLQPAVLGGFSDDTFGSGSAGSYRIQLTGVTVTAVPEPASAGLVALGLAAGAIAARRRRAAVAAAAAVAVTA